MGRRRVHWIQVSAVGSGRGDSGITRETTTWGCTAGTQCHSNGQTDTPKQSTYLQTDGSGRVGVLFYEIDVVLIAVGHYEAQIRT